MRYRVIAATIATGVAAALFAAGPAAAVNIGQEGCTPGYWKNHTDDTWPDQDWEEYNTTDLVHDQWTIPASLNIPADTTFLQALSLRGGSGEAGAAQILLRASVAAYLNAANEGVGYPYRRFNDTNDPADTVSPMQTSINAALAGNRDGMIELASVLDAANNLGCPLS